MKNIVGVPVVAETPPPGTGPRTFVYYRHSTDKQTTLRQHQNISALLQKYPDKLQPVFLAEADEAISGKTEFEERPVGRKFTTLMQPGDRLVFDRIDRLSRNYLGGLNTVVRLAQKQKVELWPAMHEGLSHLPIDAVTPIGQFMISVLLFAAAVQRERISEYTRESLRARKKLGFAVTRPSYGYRIEGPKGAKVMVPDPDQQANLERIWEMHTRRGHDTMTYPDIADAMNRIVDSVPEGEKQRHLYSKGRRWDWMIIRKMVEARQRQKQNELRQELEAAAQLAKTRDVA